MLTLLMLLAIGNKIGEEGACAIAASLPRTQLSRLVMVGTYMFYVCALSVILRKELIF